MSLISRFDPQEHKGGGSTLPVAAATIIYSGNMAAADGQGHAVPATDTAGLVIAGIALPTTGNTGGTLGGGLNTYATLQPEDVDNSNGAAGAKAVPVRAGIFRVRNSSSSPLSVADLGTVAVVQDPETVAKASTHNIPAGVVLILEQGFVWIWFVSYPSVVPVSAWRSFGVGTFGS